jgi:replicative DNA helicase
MRRGEVYVIGGSQGSGKTSMGLQFILAALRAKFGVLEFSMEMGWREVFQRLVALEARVDLLEFARAQRHNGFVQGDRVELDRVAAEISQYALTVSTRSGVTPEYVVTECERLRKRQAVDFVVLDHMQLMATTGSVRGDYEKFTAISRAMKEVARSLDAPVLVLSQTSRNQAHDKRAELEVSDLRGSGAIEEDAAAVMLLYPDREDAQRCMESGLFARGPVKTWLKL